MFNNPTVQIINRMDGLFNMYYNMSISFYRFFGILKN